MADKTNEKYELLGTANVGETITLNINSTTVYTEDVPAWATEAVISFKVQFNKAV